MATAMMEKTIKVGKLYREFFVRKDDINVDKRTVALSFSSETEEVERYFGIEILDHGPNACDLKRLRKTGALLMNHDPNDQIGVIEEADIGADRKGRAVVKFSRGAKASEIFQDIVDGIRRNVSCGYDPLEMKLERQMEGGPDVYRVTKWMPFEISLVSIPADTSVGIGRGGDQNEREIKVAVPKNAARADEMKKPECHSKDMEPKMKPEECKQGEDCENARCDSAKKAPRNQKPKGVRTMEKCTVCGADLVDGKCPACAAKAQKRDADLAAASAAAAKPNPVEMEQRRKQAITNLCKMNNLGDNYREMWIGQGSTLEQVSDDMLKIFEERGKTNPQPLSKIGLSQSETQQFSLMRAINACYTKDWKDAGFELEASRTVAQKLNKMPHPMKFFVPFEVLQRPVDMSAARNLRQRIGMHRDLTVASDGAGGYLVGTENIGFIEMLRNRAVIFRVGARRLSGLNGNVTVPRQSAGATAYWLSSESTQATEGNQTFVQMSLTPKTVAAYTEISHLLLLQSSPGAEGIVSDDLAQQVALAADLGALEGSGAAGQPQGIVGTTGVGTVTGTTLGYAGVLNFQEDVATSNVTPLRGAYVTSPSVASLMMQRVKFTSTASPLWEGNIWDGNMAGFPAMSTNQITATSMIFGDWQELVIGEWGVLEVEVNPFANFQAGIVGVRAIYSLDAALRRPFAFSTASSIT